MFRDRTMPVIHHPAPRRPRGNPDRRSIRERDAETWAIAVSVERVEPQLVATESNVDGLRRLEPGRELDASSLSVGESHDEECAALLPHKATVTALHALAFTQTTADDSSVSAYSDRNRPPIRRPNALIRTGTQR